MKLVNFNMRHVKTGHLWQGRLKACVMDEANLWNAVRHVEQGSSSVPPIYFCNSPRTISAPRTMDFNLAKAMA